jgi:hypothetical protein
MKRVFNSKPFTVKSAGGAASQCLALMNAIYISRRIKRPFVLKHFPYSTGGYFPLAIELLLSEEELDQSAGMTKGFKTPNVVGVGKIIENHPLLRKGLSWEKLFRFIRKIKLERPIKLLRNEWSLNYSIKVLKKVPRRVSSISGGYVPIVDAEVRQEMDKRFKTAGIPSPFDPRAIAAPVPKVVIHYRIGEKRTTYSHAGLGGDGIIDPVVFARILEAENLLESDGIYVVSDEPSVAQKLLLEVGIVAKINPIRGDLWVDMCLMSRADILICPWSTVSQLAATYMVQDNKNVYYPTHPSSQVKLGWSIEGVKLYTPVYLPQEHAIYKGNFEFEEDPHKIYDTK